MKLQLLRSLWILEDLYFTLKLLRKHQDVFHNDIVETEKIVCQVKELHDALKNVIDRLEAKTGEKQKHEQ